MSIDAGTRDLRGLGSELRGEMAELRGEMHQGFAEVRIEIAQQSQSLFSRVLMLQVAMLAIVVALVGTDLLR